MDLLQFSASPLTVEGEANDLKEETNAASVDVIHANLESSETDVFHSKLPESVPPMLNDTDHHVLSVVKTETDFSASDSRENDIVSQLPRQLLAPQDQQLQEIDTQTGPRIEFIGKREFPTVDSTQHSNLEINVFVDKEKPEVPEGRRRSLRGRKNDLLADLPVQFGAALSPSFNSSPLQKGTKRKPRSRHPRGKTRDKTQTRTPGEIADNMTYTVDISREVLEQWRHIGTQTGLSTDTDIAALLVQSYQDTENRVCATCQSPLRLLCSQCPPSPLSPTCPTTLLPSVSAPLLSLPTSPAAQQSVGESDGADDAVDQMVPSKPDQGSEPRSKKKRSQVKGQQAHICPECGSQFARAGGLKVHMRTHTGEKPFVCSECSQAFTTSGQLTNHLRKHSGERPFACTLCSATFPVAGSLKQHMRVHTGDRPYACHVCQQRFSYRGDLTAHLRKHTGDRPFLCSDCGKSFSMSSHLSKHKRIHSSHRPFECTVCHKGFPFLNRLTLHMRTHTGEKPFLCADCGASFTRASTLTIHRRIHHTFEKPCICPFCQHAFADSANLSKHKKYKHGVHKTNPSS